MKFSLLTKFFLSFLITGILLVGLMVGLMQFYTFRNFGNYVDRLEMTRLTGLVEKLAEEYKSHGGWDFVRHNHRVWTKILIHTGLIDQNSPAVTGADPNPPDPFQDPPPGPPTVSGRRFPPPRLENEYELPPRPPPPPPPPGRRPNPLQAGPRLTLFDADYHTVMGRALSTRNHILKPIKSGDEIVGYLGLQKLDGPSDPLDHYYIKQQKKVIYLIGGLFFILSVLISVVLASHLLAPIKKMSKATRMLAQRRFGTRVDISSTDELGALASDFNAMSRRLGEYENNQKQWLSDISHELRTPMAILIGEIDAIRDGIRKPDQGTIQSIQAEILHLQKLIDDLHTLFMEESKTSHHQNRPVKLIPLLEQTVARFSDKLEKNKIDVRLFTTQAQNAVVSGDKERLSRLFSNIINNTCRYTDPPGKLEITAEKRGSMISLTVEDSAPGVGPDKIDRIFDRLFRADPSRGRKTGGSGIGLAICKNIVESHGGVIDASKSKLGGLKMTLCLPLLTHTPGRKS